MTIRISFEEASARFGIGSILPAYDEAAEVVLLAPGRHPPSVIDLDAASYVVDGDLRLDGTLRAGDEGSFLVVRGTLSVDNLLLGGPMVYVAGALSAAHAIHTDYNHGWLRVDGDVRARVIAAEHLFEIRGRLDCETTIDFGGLRVSDPAFAPTLTRQQAARESRSYFVAEVLNDQGYVDGGALAELLADGRHPLRR